MLDEKGYSDQPGSPFSREQRDKKIRMGVRLGVLRWMAMKRFWYWWTTGKDKPGIV